MISCVWATLIQPVHVAVSLTGELGDSLSLTFSILLHDLALVELQQNILGFLLQLFYILLERLLLFAELQTAAAGVALVQDSQTFIVGHA